MGTQRLLIHADTHPAVGVGHLVRCLSLAHAWTAAGGSVELVIQRLPEAFASAVPAGTQVTAREDGEVTPHVQAASERADWVVLDSYRVPLAVMAEIGTAVRLAVLRDHGMAAPAAAQMIIDPNEGAEALAYASQAPGAIVLAGSRYALLRPSFRAARQAPPGSTDRGLVMVGGSPSEAVTDLMVEVLGALSRPLDVLGRGLGDASLPATVGHLATAADPVPHMIGRPWALVPAGSTVWELCCLGVPAVVFAAAPNQERVGEAVADAGVATYLGPVEDLTAEAVVAAVELLATDDAARTEMASRARALVDGDGAARVVAELRAADIELRRVRADDAELLFEWANDPEVRAASFRSEPIVWDEHRRWLDGRLADPEEQLFIGEVDREPIGQIRFDRYDDEHLRVGVSLASAARGRRLAAPLIAAATRVALEGSTATGVVAEIKPDNDRSAAAFATAAYVESGSQPDVRRFVRRT